jgi:ATP phosphoribosyltransferase
VDRLVAAGASRRPNGLLVEASAIADAATALTEAGLGPVTASRPDFVFDVECPPYQALQDRVL